MSDVEQPRTEPKLDLAKMAEPCTRAEIWRLFNQLRVLQLEQDVAVMALMKHDGDAVMESFANLSKEGAIFNKMLDALVFAGVTSDE